MIGIINCGSSFIPRIADIVSSFNRQPKVVHENGISCFDFSKCEALIISGSPIFLTEIEAKEYIKKFEFIKTLNIPIYGICHGHQVLGLLHGAEIAIGKKISTMETISVVEEDQLLRGIATGTEFREEHREYITLPSPFTLLAKSASCPNEAMRHGTKPIFGTQFHPEASGEQGRAIFNNFFRTIASYERGNSLL